MAIAEQVFLASGFAATTMQMVAAEAGASKETLYRHFGSKETLFAEVVGKRSSWLREKLDANFDRPNVLKDVLHDLGTRLLKSMCRPEVVSLARIVIAESPRDPELGRLFYSHGPKRTLSRLAEYLEAARGRGEFRGEHPERAAGMFLGAVLGCAHLAHLTFANVSPLGTAEIEAQVTEAVAMFLDHYG